MGPKEDLITLGGRNRGGNRRLVDVSDCFLQGSFPNIWLSFYIFCKELLNTCFTWPPTWGTNSQVPGVPATGSGWSCNCWSRCATDWLFLSFSKPYEWMSDFAIAASLQECLTFPQTSQALNLRGSYSPNAADLPDPTTCTSSTQSLCSFLRQGPCPPPVWIAGFLWIPSIV